MTDLGERIFCRVIGSNVYGADTAYSNVVGPVTAGPIGSLPVNAGGIDAPDVTGTPTEGEELYCDYGVWSGDLPMSFAYQWFQHVADPPLNTAAPFISGSALVGVTLHCTQGTWEGDAPITYEYLWWIPPATSLGTGADYTVLIGDLGTTIHCTVTATNVVDSVSAEASNTKGPITEAPPAEVLTDEFGDPLTDDLGEELTT